MRCCRIATCRQGRTRILRGAREQPVALLEQAEFIEHVGERNIAPHDQAALAPASEIRADATSEAVSGR